VKIQVLGMGCAKCFSMERNVREAVARLSLNAEIEKVSDLNQIISMGVMMTPAMAIDGKVVSSGKALSTDQIINYIKERIGK